MSKNNVIEKATKRIKEITSRKNIRKNYEKEIQKSIENKKIPLLNEKLLFKIIKQLKKQGIILDKNKFNNIYILNKKNNNIFFEEALKDANENNIFKMIDVIKQYYFGFLTKDNQTSIEKLNKKIKDHIL